jgi:site-specific DNA recombinase
LVWTEVFPDMSRKRCAIYTRKSTEEGLDQAFNSLDAQREACSSYIASQKHEGWSLVKNSYDDGGYTGGNIERPGLKRLLDDIRAGLVDVVVVYKIDRLTRSLADFAKMVELFDAKTVSFVSVTQQFNTTTSMGRLTLNVLLSFAQFEREVTAERIRDKIAASKKRGLWMGGHPPLGYDVKDKMLVVNPMEAEVVRRIFKSYLELGSTGALTAWAKSQGIVTKLRRNIDGTIRCGGSPFSRGNLHALLSYHAYVGEIAHAGNIYPGKHEALMPRELWDAIQVKLSSTRDSKIRDGRSPTSRPLTGMLFDETGDRLTPVHTTKHNRRYYYYISKRLIEGQSPDPTGWRLPANMLEDVAVQAILNYLRDPKTVHASISKVLVPDANEYETFNQIVQNSNAFICRLENNPTSSRLTQLIPLFGRIEVAPGKLSIGIRMTRLARLLGLSKLDPENLQNSNELHQLTIPFTLKRRGVEAHLIVTTSPCTDQRIDPTLVRVVSKARTWFAELSSNPNSSVKAIAEREKLPASEVSRHLPLAFLSPRIVSAILQGQQPVELTTKILLRKNIPLEWDQQAKALGFAEG